MPWFQGLATRSLNVDNHLAEHPILPPNLDSISHRAGNHVETRYHRHVKNCPNTRQALHRVQVLKKNMLALAIASITLSCGVSSTSNLLPYMPKKWLKVMISLIPLSSLAAAGLHKLEQCFFVSFKRKEQMSIETGL